MTKPKLGRKPRAAGVPMVKMGVAIQQPHRDVLDLLSRHNNQSLSQCIEWMIEQVSKTVLIEGRSPFELVNHQTDQTVDDLVRAQLTKTTSFFNDGKPDFISRRARELKRWLTMPVSLLKPHEKYFVELRGALAPLGLPDSDERLVALEETAGWFYQNSLSVDHVAGVFKRMHVA
jgi:hypothetical protein